MPKKQSLQAYAAVQTSVLSGRALEAYAVFRAVQLLRECQERWGDGGHETRLREALAYTQRLWTIFQAELIEEHHPFPLELKRNVLRLSLLIDQGVFDIVAYPAPEKLSGLIMINREVAAGLATSPETERHVPATE